MSFHTKTFKTFLFAERVTKLLQITQVINYYKFQLRCEPELPVVIGPRIRASLSPNSCKIESLSYLWTSFLSQSRFAIDRFQMTGKTFGRLTSALFLYVQLIFSPTVSLSSGYFEEGTKLFSTTFQLRVDNFSFLVP